MEDLLINLRDQEISQIVLSMQDWLIQKGKTVRDADCKTLVTAARHLKRGGEDMIKKNRQLFRSLIAKL